MQIILKNRSNHQVKFAKLGFSFTTLFFGIFVPLVRGDWKIFLPLFAIYLSGLYFTPFQIVTIDGFTSIQVLSENSEIYTQINAFLTFVVNILGSLFYNKIYTQALVNKGFLPVSPEGEAFMLAKRIKFNSPLEF
ncbi:MAG: hypothetical protein ACRCS8_05715 [Brevinema sp.]